MSALNNGGPAFPHDATQIVSGRTGMELRDYFAAKAMQAFITAQSFTGNDVPEMAYRFADAMLAERERVRP